jgi:hypothetical protein
MPSVLNKVLLAKAYQSASKKIEKNQIPTSLLQSGQAIYRSFNPISPHIHLPKPLAGQKVRKQDANQLLIPPDGIADLNNRFSGPSYDPAIPAAAGFYSVLQQQALINENMHYTRKPGDQALNGKCVIRLRLMAPMLIADLSPHNGGARKFLQDLAVGTWDRMSDKDDCSIARGIGLAIAHSRHLTGLIAQTVRESERSPLERGDNLVLFATPGKAIPNVYIDEAYYFTTSSAVEVFPVEFML